MMKVIRLKANYPEYRIKSICIDNVVEFLSRALITIVWLRKLKYIILFHMFIHKIVWQNL
jgi:hypothetical protein